MSVSAHKMASLLSSCRPVVEQIIGSGASRVPQGPEPWRGPMWTDVVDSLLSSFLSPLWFRAVFAAADSDNEDHV